MIKKCASTEGVNIEGEIRTLHKTIIDKDMPGGVLEKPPQHTCTEKYSTVSLLEPGLRLGATWMVKLVARESRPSVTTASNS